MHPADLWYIRSKAPADCPHLGRRVTYAAKEAHFSLSTKPSLVLCLICQLPPDRQYVQATAVISDIAACCLLNHEYCKHPSVAPGTT